GNRSPPTGRRPGRGRPARGDTEQVPVASESPFPFVVGDAFALRDAEDRGARWVGPTRHLADFQGAGRRGVPLWCRVSCPRRSTVLGGLKRPRSETRGRGSDTGWPRPPAPR